jgi:hypothetical protein
MGIEQMKTTQRLAVTIMAMLALSATAMASVSGNRGLLSNRETTCTPGDSYWATDSPAGQNLSVCLQQNVWVQGNSPACQSITISAVGGNWVVAGVVQEAINATLTQTITLAALPANYDVTSVRVKHFLQFVGSGVTALSFSVGSQVSGNTDQFSAPYGELLMAPANNLFWEDRNSQAATVAADTLTGTFTSVGANLSVLSAGTMWLSYCSTTVAQ